MKLKDVLTPSNTEEVKPGLFVQELKNGSHRVINPVVWKGNYRWKEQVKAYFCLSTLIRVGIIVFLIYAYIHDTSQLRDFYEDVMDDPRLWCQELEASLIVTCTETQAAGGLCDIPSETSFTGVNPSETSFTGVNLSNLGVMNFEEDTDNVQTNN